MLARKLLVVVCALGVIALGGPAHAFSLAGNETIDGTAWHGYAAASGDGTRGAPWTYNIAENIDLAGFRVGTATAAGAANYRGSVTLNVTGSVLDTGGGGTFDASTTNSRHGGSVKLTATGSVTATYIKTGTNQYQTYHGGDVYISAGGAVTIDNGAGVGAIDSSAAQYKGAGGAVTAIAGGGADITIGKDAGNWSVNASSYRQNEGGNVLLQTGGNVTLAGGIDSRGGMYTNGDGKKSGNITINGGSRAGDVTIGGSILTNTGRSSSASGLGGDVNVEAASLTVSGNIVTWGKQGNFGGNPGGRGGNVDVDVTGDCTVTGYIDTRQLYNDKYTSAGGRVAIEADHIRVEGVDGSGRSIVTENVYGAPLRSLRPDQANVRLIGTDSSTEYYNGTMTDPDDPGQAPLGGDTSSVYVAGDIVTSYGGQASSLGNVTIEAVGIWLGGDVVLKDPQGRTTAQTVDIDYGVADHGVVTHLYERGSWVQWDGVSAHLRTYTGDTVTFDATVPYAGAGAGIIPEPGVLSLLGIASLLTRRRRS